ncbi:hypothetical protein CJU68_25770 [Escherichia coli]|nr:hypothetical protein CJU68_25770 [Escherichia coli]
MSIKNDGHYFCRAGGNRPDGLNEPVTINCNPDVVYLPIWLSFHYRDIKYCLPPVRLPGVP